MLDHGGRKGEFDLSSPSKGKGDAICEGGVVYDIPKSGQPIRNLVTCGKITNLELFTEGVDDRFFLEWWAADQRKVGGELRKRKDELPS